MLIMYWYWLWYKINSYVKMKFFWICMIYNCNLLGGKKKFVKMWVIIVVWYLLDVINDIDLY